MGMVRNDPDQPASINQLIADADKQMYEEKSRRRQGKPNRDQNKNGEA